MAKPSAHNRVELARVVKSLPDKPDSGFVDEKLYKTFMSDGKILEKLTARWKDRGDLHSWGWKVVAKHKEWDKKTYEDKQQLCNIWVEQKLKQGYTKLS